MRLPYPSSATLAAFGAWLALALAAPLVAQAQSLDVASLEGNWVRAGSNYNPNDQMRITITRGEATLTRVPTTVHTSFQVGQALWMGIQSDGAVQVRGSDRKYYPGTLTLSSGGKLTLAVDLAAPGDDQIWERAGPTVDGEWVRIAPGEPAVDGMRILADQDQAVIRFLPAEAARAFRIGSRIWRGIGAGGAVQVLGNDRSYQPAAIRLVGADSLWVDGTALGHPELWVRPAIAASARGPQRATPP